MWLLVNLVQLPIRSDRHASEALLISIGSRYRPTDLAVASQSLFQNNCIVVQFCLYICLTLNSINPNYFLFFFTLPCFNRQGMFLEVFSDKKVTVSRFWHHIEYFCWLVTDRKSHEFVMLCPFILISRVFLHTLLSVQTHLTIFKSVRGTTVEM